MPVAAADWRGRCLIRILSAAMSCSASDYLDQAAGATAILESSAFERRFRDMHAVTQQLQGRLAHFETVGQYVLGLGADTT